MKTHRITPTKQEGMDMLELVGVTTNGSERPARFIFRLPHPTLQAMGLDAMLWLAAHSRRRGQLVEERPGEWSVTPTLLRRVPAAYANSRPAVRRALQAERDGITALTA